MESRLDRDAVTVITDVVTAIDRLRTAVLRNDGRPAADQIASRLRYLGARLTGLLDTVAGDNALAGGALDNSEEAGLLSAASEGETNGHVAQPEGDQGQSGGSLAESLGPFAEQSKTEI